MTLVGPAGILTGSLNRQRASQAAAAAAVTIAAAALAGWWAGVPLLSTWVAGLPEMKPVGALSLVALGVALLYPGRDQRLAIVIGLIIASLAAFLLLAALFNARAAAEWLALRSPPPSLEPDGTAFRIVHASTAAFALAGAALALSRPGRYRAAGTLLAALSAVIILFALLGYLTGIDTLHGVVASPPVPTAVGLLCVALGIILQIGVMPVLRRPRPLWHFLAALGCAIIVPLLLFGAYAEISIADEELDEVRNALTREARAISAEVDRQILGEIQRLQTLSASPSLAQGDFAAFRHQAEASLAFLRQTGRIALVDRDMRVLVRTGIPEGSPVEGPAAEKAAVPESVQSALATGDPQFTDPFVGSTGESMIGIVVPVQINGENRYALVRSIARNFLSEPVSADNLPPGWQAAVANARHYILARTLKEDGAGEQVGAELPQSQRQHGGRTSGSFEFTDAEGRPSLEAYADSNATGWETVVWEPKAQLEAPVRTLWRTLGWLALLSLGLVVTLALSLGGLIARSVGGVATAAARTEGVERAAQLGETPVAEVNALMAELREASARRQASENLLRDSERKLRLVSDTVPIAIARCDAEGRFTFANKHFLDRHGLTESEVIGSTVPEVLGDAYVAFRPYLAECLAGNAVECEAESRGRNGEPICLQGRFVPEWHDGKVIGLIGATSDITRLKQAEQRLRASEVTFRQLVDHSPFGVFVTDAGLRVVQASTGARKAFDDTKPLIGRDLDEAVRSMWPEPCAAAAIDHFRHTLEAGEPYREPASTAQRKDTGAVESYDWTIERIVLPDGRFGVVCHFYDLSERQRSESALRESEATFRAMFDASAVGKIEVVPGTGRFLRANAAMCQFIGYSEEELLSRSVLDITHPDDRDADREALHRMATGLLPIFDREKRYIRKNGQAVWVRVTSNVICNEAGRPLRNTAVIQDLNERKRAEQELEASRARLQLALDAAQLGWFHYDPINRIGQGDARFKEIFDLTADETRVDELMRHLHPDDVEKAKASLAEHLDPLDPRPAVVEFRIRRRDGEIRWAEIHGLAYFEGAGRERRPVSLIGTAQDITERKQHEEQTQLLMREVNYRAKNMLSVVDAIAHQTATRNPEDFIVRFSERIQALSANQDLLVRNDWKGVGMMDLVRTQLAHFSDLIGSRIVVCGPALRLQAASAQAIGLALHELATNAGKYGALSTGAGRVDVSWWTENDVLHIRWIESGGPPVTAPERRGFGTVVMEAMAERTVGGKVDLDYGVSGVTWHLTCPATNALERAEHEPEKIRRVPA